MKSKILSFIIIQILFCGVKLYSQDIHFSQTDASPLLINPALTGSFQGNQRVILNYKDQWRSLGAAYKTVAFQYDATILKNYLQHKEKIGVGVSFYNDQAGEANFGTTQGNILLSYFKYLNPKSLVSIGFQGGYVQNKYNPGNLTWDDQFDSNYNPTLPTREPNGNSVVSYLDLAAGFTWDYRYEKYSKTNFGISLNHVNPIEANYYPLSQKRNLYRKITVHGTLEKKLKRSETTFYPSFIYRKQGPSQEFLYGLLIKYQLSEEKFQSNVLETAVNFGVYHRYGDSFIFMAKLSYMHFTFGISYDIIASKLTVTNTNKGGVEFSLIYITPYERRYKGNAQL